MDPKLKTLLEEQLKVSKESLEILKKLNRARQWAKFFMIARWVVIIGFLIFGFIAIRPYLESLEQTINTASQTLNELNTYYFTPRQ